MNTFNFLDDVWKEIPWTAWPTVVLLVILGMVLKIEGYY